MSKRVTKQKYLTKQLNDIKKCKKCLCSTDDNSDDVVLSTFVIRYQLVKYTNVCTDIINDDYSIYSNKWNLFCFQEIEFIQNSLSQLKVVQTKFIESRDNLDKMVPGNKGKEILVPLTSSVSFS